MGLEIWDTIHSSAVGYKSRENGQPKISTLSSSDIGSLKFSLSGQYYCLTNLEVVYSSEVVVVVNALVSPHFLNYHKGGLSPSLSLYEELTSMYLNLYCGRRESVSPFRPVPHVAWQLLGE